MDNKQFCTCGRGDYCYNDTACRKQYTNPLIAIYTIQMTEPNKELPKEVQESIQKDMEDQEIYGLDYEFGLNNGAQIAQGYYEPFITSAQQDAQIYKSQLSEKDATISKLMGLLKEEFKRYHKYPHKYSKQEIERMWEGYCKSHGIDLGGE